MPNEIRVLQDGSVTTPEGFLAAATYAGLKSYRKDKLDLGLIFSELPATAAGTFTRSLVRSPSVDLCQLHIASGSARAIIVNSGCANCCVGSQGRKDAEEVASLTADQVGSLPQEVLFCSTGVIGEELPMSLLRSGIPQLHPSRDAGHAFARAIMTTDSGPKEIAVSFSIDDVTVHIGGCAKGSGMIHPDMATMLAFLTTDASVEPAMLQNCLKEAVDKSFNMIDVDGDRSTNDSVILMSNSACGGPVISEGTVEAARFSEALLMVCVELAKSIARDGEGSNKLIEVLVDGALSTEGAKVMARTISSSVLVKIAVHGNDPNWGRILAALGRSGAQVQEGKVTLFVNEICIMDAGTPIHFFKDAVIAAMNTSEVVFRLQLGLGEDKASAWSCDLTEEYVTFNSAYTYCFT